MPAAVSELDQLINRGLAALPDVRAARRVADVLVRRTDERAVFGLCLLTLEMALLHDSRACHELPARVPVLLDAYRDPDRAARLLGHNQALRERWQKVLPVVAEFVSGHPLDSRRSQVDSRESTVDSRPATTDSSHACSMPSAPLDAPPPEGEAGARGRSGLRSPQEIGPSGLESAGGRPAGQVPGAAVPPSSLPRSVTPVEELAIEEVLDSVGAAVAPGGPPPPPPDAFAPRPAPVEAPPPLPREALASDSGRGDFWGFVDKALDRVPEDSEDPQVRSLRVERGADRARLESFARELLERFPNHAGARALCSLVQLFVAGQQKERGALAGVNRDRQELIRSGLSLLPAWSAAADVAVLFENDGPETRASFAVVVDLVRNYLLFCHRNHCDPAAPEAVERFAVNS